MVIAILFLIRILLLLSLVTLLVWLAQSNRIKDIWQTVYDGMKEAWKGVFVHPNSPRYPVDLYVWETANDESVCEDCRDRASWPPMDIADWMLEGLPKTPEAETECGENCRCKLVRYNPKKHKSPQI